MYVVETPPDPVGERVVSESTAGEWGDRLPLGFLVDGTLHRAFAFRPFRSKIERDLDEKRRDPKNRGVNQVEWAAIVLATMLVRLGPFDDFGALSEVERRATIMRCFLPDVMYMLVRLRTYAMGHEVCFNVTCASCRHEWKPTVDLNEVPLKICERAVSLSVRHRMRDGLEVNGKVYYDLLLDPPRWGSVAGQKAPGIATIEFATMVGAIRYASLEGAPLLQVTSDILGESTKYDFELLKKVVDDQTLGPNLLLTADCPLCTYTTRYGMDWSWDFFFKSPSMPLPAKS